MSERKGGDVGVGVVRSNGGGGGFEGGEENI